jgi:outer membrane protein
VRRRGSRRIRILLAAPLLLAAGCATRSVDHDVAPSSGTPWQAPSEARPPVPPVARPDVPESYLVPGTKLSLPQVLDVALRNNPTTRVAWHNARAAAADVQARRSAYYPSFELDAQITRQKQAANGGQFIFLQTTYGPTLSMSWLLLDLGGRAADVSEARQLLFAADWTHNAAIQNLMLVVEQAYYRYLAAKALLAAQEANLKQAKESLAAADARHRAGVATIADVLQLKTAASQAELDLESVQGNVQTIRGALATAVGVSPGVPVELGDLPADVDVDTAMQAVDELIVRAQERRPDLAAARLQAEAARAHIRSAESAGLPSLAASGSLNRTYYYNHQGLAPYSNNYAGSILFRFPVFTGYNRTYEILKAREQAEAADASADLLRDQVNLQVWTGYFDVKTGAARVKTARDLLASASQSLDVALERYKAGVGNILDVLTAQTAFAAARAQDVQARSDWLVAVAQLAHDTGSIELPGPATSEGAR